MDCCKLRVRLLPRARRDEIVGLREGALVVRVSAPPIEGRANDALRRLLAGRLRIGTRRVVLAQGERSRDKLVQIEGLSEQQVLTALELD